MTQFSFSGSVVKEDHVAVLHLLVSRQMKHNLGSTAVLASPAVTWLAVAACIAILGFRAVEVHEGWVHYGELYLGLFDYLMAGLVLWVLIGSVRSGARPTRQVAAKSAEEMCIDGVTMGPVEFSADEEGVAVNFPKRQTRYKWAAFSKASWLEDAVLLETTPTCPVLIPANAFSDDAQRQSFFAFAEQKIAAA